MARCTVCDLPALSVVDRALVVGNVSVSELARRHGVSLLRHQAKHLPKAMVAAHEAGAEDRAAELLAEIEALKVNVQELLASSKEKGDTRGAVTAIREGTRLVELIGKLRGDLKPAPTVQVNLVQSNEFQTVAGAIIEVLRDYPEARARVVETLRALAH